MALPPLTPEQRAAALEKAAVARRERAAVKNRLKYAQGSLAEVIADGKANDVVGKMRVSALLESHARRRPGARPPDHGGGRHLREPPRAWPRPEPDRRPARPASTAGRDGTARPPRRPRRTDRRRQGHRRRLRPRHTTPRSGSRSRRPPARRARARSTGIHYHFVADAEFERMDAGRRAARVGRRARRGQVRHAPRARRGGAARPAGWRCSRSTCRAPARCARPCRRPSSSSSPRPAGRSWCAGWSAGAPRTRRSARRRLATARVELAAAEEFDVTIVNDDVRRAAEELVSLMRSH